jgi:hypothetical protein
MVGMVVMAAATVATVVGRKFAMAVNAMVGENVTAAVSGRFATTNDAVMLVTNNAVNDTNVVKVAAGSVVDASTEIIGMVGTSTMTISVVIGAEITVSGGDVAAGTAGSLSTSALISGTTMHIS